MKRMRKGFTLIELLIVVAIMGALAAMMAASSSDSIDSAQASAILNNLQSMKTAAYEMYMGEPAVAGLTAIDNDTSTTEDTAREVKKVFGGYLGRVDIPENYGIAGDTEGWYVYYTLQPEDSAKVKTILNNKANNVGLLGATDSGVDALKAVEAYYEYDESTGTDTYTVIALRVR